MKFLNARVLRWPTLLLASLLHLGWGVLLVVDQSAVLVTPLYPLSNIDPAAAGLFYILFGYLGLWAISRPVPSWGTLIALLPQQMMLVLASTAVFYSIMLGHFLDGVVRPTAFLTADHLSILLLTGIHIITLIIMHAPYVTRRKKGEARD